MRHLAGTLYAALDIPEEKRSAFYKHMGHSQIVIESIYQTPTTEADVGSELEKFGALPSTDEASSAPATDFMEENVQNNNIAAHVSSSVCSVPKQSCNESSKLLINNTGSLSRKRKITRGRWSSRDTELVVKYFSAWIADLELSSSPYKKDILKFKQQHPEILHDWKIIRNKVVNEKMAFSKRKQIKLDILTV